MSRERRTGPVPVQVPDFGLWAFHSSHDPSFAMDFARHDYHEIILVEEGAGFLELKAPTGEGGRAGTVNRLPIARGHLLATVPGLEHRFADDPGQPLSIVTICLRLEKLEESNVFRPLARLFREKAVSRAQIAGLDAFQVSRAVDLVRGIYFRQNEPSEMLAALVWGRAVELLTFWLETAREHPAGTHGGDDPLMASCAEYIRGHFTDPLPITELAARARLSSRRFTHRFKKATGKTVHRFIEELRIEYSCRQLRATGHITHAALQSGFDELSTFYRAFKKTVGVTPKAWIAEQRETP